MKKFLIITLCLIISIFSYFTFINYTVIDAEAEKLELYDGQIYHIFFHSLILDTNKAFNSYKAEGYDDWMTTRYEFKKMLPYFYKNNFILIDIESTIDRKNGKIVKKDLYLPKGKKPLVISIDDVNYYDYMKGHGFAEKLSLNSKGEITTLVRENNKLIEDNEGDIIPILDSFVKKHPDFSHNGAKGVIALTGYEGALGYRISTSKGIDLTLAEIQAKAVAKKLKQTGWKFACHSFTHNGYFRDGNVKMNKLVYDTSKWINFIQPIVGKTSIYISPFGYHLKADDERMKYLNKNGFDIFCPVYYKMNTQYFDNVMIQQRFNLDGFTFQKYPQRIPKDFFEVSAILDPTRKLAKKV